MDAVADRDVFIEFRTLVPPVPCAQPACRGHDTLEFNGIQLYRLRMPLHWIISDASEKNPDSFELIRGKTGRIIAVHQFMITVKAPTCPQSRPSRGQTTGFDSLDKLSGVSQLPPDVCPLLPSMRETVVLLHPIILLAADLADYLVERAFHSKSHHVVGELVALSKNRKVSLPDLSDADA